MDNLLTTLKVGLATQLQKQGSSLEELEAALSNIEHVNGMSKAAELLSKTAFFGEGAVDGIAGFGGNVLKSIPEWGMTTALMAGSLGGAGAYGIKKHLEGQDKEYSEKEQEVQRIKQLTERLKSDYGIRQHG